MCMLLERGRWERGENNRMRGKNVAEREREREREREKKIN